MVTRTGYFSFPFCLMRWLICCCLPRLLGALLYLDVSSKSCAHSLAAEGGQLSSTQYLLCPEKIPDVDGAGDQRHLPAIKSWCYCTYPIENQGKMVLLPAGQGREISQHRTLWLCYWFEQVFKVSGWRATDQSASQVHARTSVKKNEYTFICYAELHH